MISTVCGGLDEYVNLTFQILAEHKREICIRFVIYNVNSLKLGQFVDDDSDPNTGISLC